ncbi:MAG: hypothetical protein WCO19_03950 [Candidatus Saccharibacteria bacterium]
MPSTKAPTRPASRTLSLNEAIAGKEANPTQFHELWLNGWIKRDILSLRDLAEMIGQYELQKIVIRHFGVELHGDITSALHESVEDMWIALHQLLENPETTLLRRVYALRLLIAFKRENRLFDLEIIERWSEWLDRFSLQRFELCIEIIRRGDYDHIYNWALHEASAMFTDPMFEPGQWAIKPHLSRFETDCEEAALERAVDERYGLVGLYETLTMSGVRSRINESFSELWSI